MDTCDWVGHAQTFFVRNAPLVQQGMHIAAHIGTEMVVKKACTIGLRSCLKVAKGKNRSRKQTHTDCRYGYTPVIRVYTAYRPLNYGDLPTLQILCIPVHRYRHVPPRTAHLDALEQREHLEVQRPVDARQLQRVPLAARVPGRIEEEFIERPLNPCALYIDIHHRSIRTCCNADGGAVGAVWHQLQRVPLAARVPGRIEEEHIEPSIKRSYTERTLCLHGQGSCWADRGLLHRTFNTKNQLKPLPSALTVAPQKSYTIIRGVAVGTPRDLIPHISEICTSGENA
jgi:hypothetical protein